MKKKTLLSLLTGIAIVASTAGTYAAWDKLSDTSKGTVSFRQPVTINATPFGDLNATSEIGATPTATTNVSFTVENPGKLESQLTITPSIDEGNKSGVSLNDLKITIKSPDGNTTWTSGSSGNFVDSNIREELKTAENNKLNYSITITAANGDSISSDTIQKLAKSTSLDFTGTLSTLSKSAAPTT